MIVHKYDKNAEINYRKNQCLVNDERSPNKNWSREIREPRCVEKRSTRKTGVCDNRERVTIIVKSGTKVNQEANLRIDLIPSCESRFEYEILIDLDRLRYFSR